MTFDFSALREGMRSLYGSLRAGIERGRTSHTPPSPALVERQNVRLAQVRAVGEMLSLIIANEASFRAWVASVDRSEARKAAPDA